MARKRRGQPVHGWVVLDKPVGLTSTAAVAAVRRIFDAAKAGHGGTLDPLATGVLPIALGEATKTIPFIMDARKSYRFTVRWGEARETDDAEGAVSETSDRRPTRAEIEAALQQFVGEIQQTPPAYSAIRIGGERAYDLARAGEVVELAARPVLIERFELLEMVDRDHASFTVRSGKGAYMRSLARDLALALGTVGHIAELRRTQVGPFAETAAIPLASLETLGHIARASGRLLPVETALDDIPALALTDAEALRLRSGQSVGLLKLSDRERLGRIRSGDLVCAMSGGKPVALARWDAGDLRPVRVLHI